MKLVILACVGAVAISFSVDSGEAQTPPKDWPKKTQPRRIVRPIVKPPITQARREVYRAEQPKVLEKPKAPVLATRPLTTGAVVSQSNSKRSEPRPAPLLATKPLTTGAVVSPQPVKAIGGLSNSRPRGANGAPLATSLAMAKENCTGANATTEWCKARDKYNADRAKYDADHAAWAKKKADVDWQNAQIDIKNAENERNIGEQRKRAQAESDKQVAENEAACAVSKSKGEICIGTVRQPQRIADIPPISHNVAPPPPTAPTAPAILASAPPPVASAPPPKTPTAPPATGSSGGQPSTPPTGPATANPTPAQPGSQPGANQLPGVAEIGRPQAPGGDSSRGSGGGRQDPIAEQPSQRTAPATGSVRPGAAPTGVAVAGAAAAAPWSARTGSRSGS